MKNVDQDLIETMCYYLKGSNKPSFLKNLVFILDHTDKSHSIENNKNDHCIFYRNENKFHIVIIAEF